MAIQDRRQRLWAIVLAADEGTRLATLTRALHGCDMPKQFAALWGGRTLLARTLDRTGAIVPRQRTIVVVPGSFKALAQEQLNDYPGIKRRERRIDSWMARKSATARSMQFLGCRHPERGST